MRRSQSWTAGSRKSAPNAKNTDYQAYGSDPAVRFSNEKDNRSPCRRQSSGIFPKHDDVYKAVEEGVGKGQPGPGVDAIDSQTRAFGECA